VEKPVLILIVTAIVFVTTAFVAALLLAAPREARQPQRHSR
jgi:hypothetical protein